MICCIDAHTFIWGVKKKCDEGQEASMEKAIYLFKWMADNRHMAMLPAVVLAEVLAPEPLERHPVIMESINKNFMVVDFDLRCASQYAHLFTNRIEDLKKIASKEDISNQKMKVDHLIVASAIVGGAGCIYSEDKSLRAFGSKYIEIRNLPHLPAVQKDLFDNDLPF